MQELWSIIYSDMTCVGAPFIWANEFVIDKAKMLATFEMVPLRVCIAT